MPRKKKSNSEPFTIIPRRTILSEELNQLSKSAFKLYIILCSKWDRNNPEKEIICTYLELTKLGIQRQAIAKSIDELCKSGFIEKCNHGGLLRNPNTYKLNQKWLSLKNRFENQT